MASVFRVALVGASLGSLAVNALPATNQPRDVDTRYPYKGPTVPIADWVDPTVNGNGKGFYRVSEPPAVKPAKANPSNNINVISMAYIPNGMNIHFQTAFGLGEAPTVMWGKNPDNLKNVATGATMTYPREPPCSAYDSATACSEFFHNVQISGLKEDTTYYYMIPAANGTTASNTMSFITGKNGGTRGQFSAILLNDMGYTNAQGTHKMMKQLSDEGAVAFALHGGDISYADDFFEGILACQDDYSCYNGTSTTGLPLGDYPKVYNKPLPAGEIPNQGGPYGGDASTIYESNWDIWQNWMNPITSKIPYMTNPGNHEAACAEFDGPGNVLTAYLNSNETNSTAAESDLTYYSCPPSQRNFTAYQNRFWMPGNLTGGKGNFWYSFDYGLVHFISFTGETDYSTSPEYPFLADTDGKNSTPAIQSTYITDSGPFGYIENNDVFNTTAYEQYQWMAADLAAVDRKKTPWIIASSHRPMYSSQVSGYQKHMRDAWEALFLQHGVDLYVSGHIHWYERLFPLGLNGTIDDTAIINNNTYRTNHGKSMVHIVNGMAGNIESHSTLGDDPVLPITHVLNQRQYGFSKLTVFNGSALQMEYVRGDGSGVGDTVTLLKH